MGHDSFLSRFALGAFTIWTNKAADVATTHVAVGALTLVLGALLTAHQLAFAIARRNLPQEDLS